MAICMQHLYSEVLKDTAIHLLCVIISITAIITYSLHFVRIINISINVSSNKNTGITMHNCHYFVSEMLQHIYVQL